MKTVGQLVNWLKYMEHLIEQDTQKAAQESDVNQKQLLIDGNERRIEEVHRILKLPVPGV